jgi:glucosamine-6-phosphate deaminase
MPSLEDDALPMANLIRARQPDILTVAFDPEGTGPDTHYKVLTVVAAGLRIALSRGDLDNPDVLVWGYRNVWFVFPPSQATLMIPCSASDLDLMHDTFMSCFTTQKKASFPSPHYDGPFSAWARQIQRDQKAMLTTLLGTEYFQSHQHPRVRDSAGFIFLHATYVKHFLAEVEDLKSKFENVSV